MHTSRIVVKMSLVSVSVDKSLDVIMKAVLIGAVFLIVSRALTVSPAHRYRMRKPEFIAFIQMECRTAFDCFSV